MAVSKIDLIQEKLTGAVGEWFPIEQLGKEFEASEATVYAAMTRMKKSGFKTERKNGQVRLKVARAEKWDNPARKAAEAKAVTPKAAAVVDLTLPGLGADLKVGGLTMDAAGKVSIILRNGKHSWAAQLVGEVGPS